MNEGEEQAHGEVGEPVHAAAHHEGRGPRGLQEDLRDEQRGDGAWGERELYSPRRSCPARVPEPPLGARWG